MNSTNNPTINFLFFLHNHKGMGKALVDCFGESLGNHFLSKLNSFMAKSICCEPKHIIKLMMEMSDDNKELFLEWVEKNYSYKK